MATTGTSRAARERTAAARERLQRVYEGWSARHPALAAEERELRRERRRRVKAFGHKVHGTVETHAHAARVVQGAVARLFRDGGITMEQYGSALEISAAHERIARDVTIGSGWGMDRVDMSANPEARFLEALGAVRSEIAYSRWRRSIEAPGMVLAIVVEDCTIWAASRRFSMHQRRARRLLLSALDAWTQLRREACREVDEQRLHAAHAALF